VVAVDWRRTPPPTLARLVPDELVEGDATGLATLDLHLQRYQFAASHVAGRVLDLACGVGYGTALLAARGETLVGVDVDRDAIAYARRRYRGPNVEFQCEDAFAFRDPDGFDAVVSLETIEHVDDPHTLMAKLVSLVRPGGVLIGSVPTTPSVDVNPHHLNDFTERGFRAMGKGLGLRELDALVQIQPVPVLGVLMRTEQRMSDMRPNLMSYYATHPLAAVRRALATVRYGFTNRYLTIAWRRADGAWRRADGAWRR
jgi:SAM-dependent methyltransferase